MGLFKKKITFKDVEELEKELGINLPRDYKEKILLLNGKNYAGAYIQHPKYEELDFSGFISLNKKDKLNIHNIYGKIIKDTRYFPIADTDFGDYFCIDLKRKEIVLYLHETEEFLVIADDFTKFLKILIVE